MGNIFVMAVDYKLIFWNCDVVRYVVISFVHLVRKNKS